MSSQKTHLFDNPKNVRRVLWGLGIACALALLGDFVIHRHVSHPWEGLWGFYAVYGFVACVLLVLVAKQMRKILMRSEDYYDHNTTQNGDVQDG
jgi:hypothetical protein